MCNMDYIPRYTRLRDGLEIPTVGLGTFQLIDMDTTKSVIKDAIRVGYRHIDTAAVYGNEEMIGEALQEIFSDESFGVNRGDIWITSKLSPGSQGYESTIYAVQISLAKLKLEYIDMYLIHWPGTSGLDPQDPQNKVNRIESWRALEYLKDKNMIREIGVSNYQISHLIEMEEYAKYLPSVNQCEFHPLLFTKDLVEFNQSLGIAFEAYSSFGEGNLVNGNYNFPVLEEIASKYCASIAQILLCWGMQHGAIILPKTSNTNRLVQNFESQKITLSEDDMDAINNISLTRTKRFIWDSNIIL
ncbi:Prostaglandin F synthase [Smittium culicis]|uniref:Prostaglandin F synthase n=1 Tax=Smittium culicis TaxID=133412 RepID=A0A1R1YGS0_9FUNG|nr:Prostaglandin F synthase [Smittium culicis]